MSMLLAKGGDLFLVLDSKQVYRTRKVALGCGAPYARVALSDEKESVENRLLNGMRLSTTFDSAVCEPYVLVNTKDMEFVEVKE